MALLGIVLGVLLAGRARPTSTAHAFDLDTHEAILRAALIAAMSGDALDDVTNYGIAVPGTNEPEPSNLALAPGTVLQG